jgi:hypothetical protein
MRIGSRLSVVAAVLFLGALPALAADVAGKWTAEFDTQVGPQKYTYELKVDGEKVTGKAFFERMGQKGEAEILEGKLAGDVLTFVEVLDFQGSSVRIEYKGTVKGDQIDFVRKVGDFATEQFPARRAKN